MLDELREWLPSESSIRVADANAEVVGPYRLGARADGFSSRLPRLNDVKLA